MSITIGIFEDHPIVQASLFHIFKQHADKYQILFTIADKEALYENLDQALPDVLVSDVMADGISGLEVFEHLNKNYKELKTIAFTSLASPILVENLLFLNVKGYVNKKQSLNDLLTAVEIVFNDHIYVPDEYLFLTKKYYHLNSSILSPREIEIVKFISQEMTSAEIAELLSLSINTVENHRKNIFSKLDVKNVAGLIREAAMLGYL